MRNTEMMLGLMMDAGRAVIPEDHFAIRDDILAALQNDPCALKNFKAFPELYEKIRVDNIQGYAHSKEETEKLIQKLVQTAHDNIIYGQWNGWRRL